MASVGHDIVVMGAFRSLMPHGEHRGGECLPFRGAWFRLWFSWKFMLSCRLCLLISCDSLVFCLLSFDCSFCLIAWYLFIFLTV